MNFLDVDSTDLRPGLVLAMPEPPAARKIAVTTDVACFLRVRHSAVEIPFDPEAEADVEHGLGIGRLWVKDLPGPAGGDYLTFRLSHSALGEWDERPFSAEYRTRHPAAARMFFDNGGSRLHLVDLDFTVPPFDPAALPEEDDPEVVAEQRLEAAFLQMYAWGLDRLDDFEGGEINQVCLPSLWTSHVHLLPEVWAIVAGYCRQTGNRFLVADSCPPFAVLQKEEQRRAKEQGFALGEDELTADALVPWYRPDKWDHREEIPVEVALTIDALEATRLVVGRDEVTLSCIGLYWPWVLTLRGMAVPPCAAVSGIYARSDRDNAPVGVMKPPANESVKAVLDVAIHIDERPQNMLRREAVNMLQTRTGKGIVVWGARTQCEDEIWRFVNVRRLLGYIGKQLQVDNQWAVFENNTVDLRATVARDARYFLHDLWEKGALKGASPDEAFRIVCDTENNPSSVVDSGILVVDVWVNPVQTNEFVHLQLTYGDALVE